MEKIDVLLLSYPRSGNTWIRYCIEFLTKQPTYGYSNDSSATFDRNPIGNFVDIGVDFKLSTVCIKRHHATNVLADKLIFILRNYKEVILRHRLNNVEDISLDLLKTSCISEDMSHNYIQLIEFYDKFEGDKLLIYYEDIISDIREIARSILLFLGKGEIFLDEFLDNIDVHKKNCIGIYEKEGETISFTKGETPIFHSNFLKDLDKKLWDSYLSDNFPQLFYKYLYRYKENFTNLSLLHL